MFMSLFVCTKMYEEYFYLSNAFPQRKHNKSNSNLFAQQPYNSTSQVVNQAPNTDSIWFN